MSLVDGAGAEVNQATFEACREVKEPASVRSEKIATRTAGLLSKLSSPTARNTLGPALADAGSPSARQHAAEKAHAWCERQDAYAQVALTLDPPDGLTTIAMDAAVTGTSTAGGTVHATMVGKTVEAPVDAQGSFRLRFDALESGVTTFSITATAPRKYPSPTVQYTITRRRQTAAEFKASAARVDSAAGLTATPQGTLVTGVARIFAITGDRAVACFGEAPTPPSIAQCDAVNLDATVSGALTNVPRGTLVQFWGSSGRRTANAGVDAPGVGIVFVDQLPN